MFLALVAILALAGEPVFGGDGGGGAVNGFLSGKLPPLRSDPAGDPALLGEEPPPEIFFTPWTDWAEGQRIIRMRRIAIDASVGASISTGPDAWTRAFSTSTASGLEVGYIFAPFLTVSFGFLAGELSGSYTSEEIDGRSYNLDFSTLNFSVFGLSTRLKIPLSLGFSELIRFSKGRAGRGIVPYFEFGIGLARLGSVRVDRSWEETPGNWVDDTILVLGRSFNFAYFYGFGFQVRWTWGGVSLDFTWRDLGTPNIKWGKSYFDGPPGGPLVVLEIGFGMGIYF